MISKLTIFVLLSIEDLLSSDSNNEIDSLASKRSQILQSIETWKNQSDSLKTRVSESINAIESELKNVSDTFENGKIRMHDMYKNWFDEIEIPGDLSPSVREKCVESGSSRFFNSYNSLDNSVNSCLAEKTKNILDRLEALASDIDKTKKKFKHYEAFIENCFVYADKMNNPEQTNKCLDEESAKIRNFANELERHLSKNVDQAIAAQPSHQEILRCLTNSEGLFYEVILFTVAHHSIAEIRRCIDALMHSEK